MLLHIYETGTQYFYSSKMSENIYYIIGKYLILTQRFIVLDERQEREVLKSERLL